MADDEYGEVELEFVGFAADLLADVARGQPPNATTCEDAARALLCDIDQTWDETGYGTSFDTKSGGSE